jgi:multiple sugar transport system permease protein
MASPSSAELDIVEVHVTRNHVTRRRTASRLVPYAFLAPAIVMFVLFLMLPIGYTVWASLHKVKVKGLGLGSGGRTEIFAGLENYRSVLGDGEFWAGVVRVLMYGAILVPTMLGLALVFALLLDWPWTRLRRFSRIAIFLPYAVPSVIASLLWGFLYLPAVSPLHYLLERLGLPRPDLLGPDSIMGSVANIGVWGGVGFNMLVLYTSLRAIPGELYESARMDGCNEFQIAWRIKIPQIVPAIVMTTIFGTITTLQVFAEPTTLRPLTNSLSTSWTPLMKIYRDAFARNDLYDAAAASIVVGLASLIVSFTFLRLVQSRAFSQENQ